MIDKHVAGAEAAVADIHDGAGPIGGFGIAGMPDQLIDARIARGRAVSTSSTMPTASR